MTAIHPVYVRTADGWQQLAYQGPEGPQGPPGTMAAAAAGGDLSGMYPNPLVDGEVGSSGDPWTIAGSGNCQSTIPYLLPLGSQNPTGYPTKRRWIRNTACTAGAKRLSLFWLSRDTANWAVGHPIIIEVHTVYFSGGGYTRSIVSGAYTQPLRLEVMEAAGAQPMRPTLSAEAVVAGNIREAHCYIDLPDYAMVVVSITEGGREDKVRPFTTPGAIAWTIAESSGGGGQDLNWDIALRGKLLLGDTPDTNLYRLVADTLKTDDSLVIQHPGGYGLLIVTPSGNASFANRLPTDSQDRIMIDPAASRIWFGDGSSGVDVNLSRGAANLLKTQNSFEVGGYLYLQDASVIQWGTDVHLFRDSADVLKTNDAFVLAPGFTSYVGDGIFGATARPGGWTTPGGNEARGRFGYDDAGGGQYMPSLGFGAPSSGYMASLRVLRTRVAFGTPEAHDRFSLQHDGKLNWGGGAAAPDVNLYRASADVLKTDDALAIGSGLVLYPATFGLLSMAAATDHIIRNFLAGGDAQPAFRIAGDGDLEWGAGGGTPADVTLYRSAPNVLKTDDAFVAAGNFVSALPGSPVDGQECYYQSAAMATDGVVWHLRYRAGSSSAYKWEFLGGAPLVVKADTARTTTSLSYVAPATDPLSLTLPLAGDWDITIEAAMYQNTTHLSNQYQSYTVGATAASDTWANNVGVALHKSTGSLTTRHLAVPASAVLAERIRIENAGSGTLSLEKRRLRAVPVRVG